MELRADNYFSSFADYLSICRHTCNLWTYQRLHFTYPAITRWCTLIMVLQ